MLSEFRGTFFFYFEIDYPNDKLNPNALVGYALNEEW